MAFPHNCIPGTSWTKIDSGERNYIKSILKSCSLCGPLTTEDTMVVSMPQPVQRSSGFTKAMGSGCFYSGLSNYKCSRLLLTPSRSLQSQDDVEWAGAWCNRSPEWNHEWMKRLNHSFATKNVGSPNYFDEERPQVDQLH